MYKRQISILNQKIKKSNEGFYINLDIENVHGYIEEDCPAIDSAYRIREVEGVVGSNRVKREYESPDFSRLGEKTDCSLDGDVVDNLPLEISFDYNSIINWIVTGQLYKRDGVNALNVLSSLFVKNEEKLHALCAKWHAYYKPHQSKCRIVYYYYDSTAKFRGYANENAEDFRDTIIKELTKKGWEVVGIDMGRPMTHEEQYKVINEALRGGTYPAIRFNRENNEALIIAMENCGVQIGYKGFRKDKSGEKLTTESAMAEGADNIIPAELRTDGTDAFDTLFLGVKLFKNRMVGMGLPLG